MGKYVLGIETSCDDTSIALVDRAGGVAASVVLSQNEIHNQFGGVYPEFACRSHILNIIPAVDEVMQKSEVSLDDIAAIGVTRGPGLVGSLIVGLNTAKSLGLVWNKKVIGINHLRGHLRSAELEGQKIEYPALILLVSGGHTFLTYMDEAGNVELLGQTRDDSLGETYDKSGRMLGLDFPAGPKIDRLAVLGESNIDFPRPLYNQGLEFSFSGLKSAVARFLDKHPDTKKEDVCASLVDAVIAILDKKSRLAFKQKPEAKSLVVVGGVAASKQVREMAAQVCTDLDKTLHLPLIKWSTDNAAMIALATWDYLDHDIHKPAEPALGLPLSEY